MEDDYSLKYETSRQFLISTIEEIKKLNAQSKNVEQILAKIAKQVISDHICVIMALHYSGMLTKLLQMSLSRFKQTKSECQKQMNILFSFGYECFFIYIPECKEILEYFKGKSKSFLDKPYAYYSNSTIERYEMLSSIVKKLMSMKANKDQPFATGKALNQFIEKQLVCREPLTCFEECAFTWLRKEAQELQQVLYKNMNININHICCRLHFAEKQKIQGIETNVQHFYQFNKIKYQQNADMKLFLRRTVISFLNSVGGVIYFGVCYEGKTCTINGLTMVNTEKNKFLFFILKEVVFEIYPYDDEQPNDDLKTIEARKSLTRQQMVEYIKKSKKEVNYQYQLNRFLSVDFINIYDKQTSLYARNQTQSPLYVVRLKVRPGDPYEVYHMVNQKEAKQTPQAYYRDDKKEKKLSMIEYCEQVYRKLKLKANHKSQDKGKMDNHPLCRISSSLKQSKIKKQEEKMDKL